MKDTSDTHIKPIPDSIIELIGDRIQQNKRVRGSLPSIGRINIDRQLPFLCIYRYPSQIWDPGTDRLVMGQASYLLATDKPILWKSYNKMIKKIVSILSKEFGAFLIIEIWSSLEKEKGVSGSIPKKIPYPFFKIFVSKDQQLSSTTLALETALLKTRILKKIPKVEIVPGKCSPPGKIPFLSPKEAKRLNCQTIGLEINPVHYNETTREEFPLVRQALHRSLARAFKRTFFKFCRTETWDRPKHYQALGKRNLVKAVWETDGKLAGIGDSFDLILLLNPINAERAWYQFKKSGFQKKPKFSYPRLPIEPSLEKRKLFSIPIERIEDPVIAEIFQEKQLEIERQINLLAQRESKGFLYHSLGLFGGVDSKILKKALEILNKLPSRTREDTTSGHLNANQFSKLAEEEIAKYQSDFPNFSGNVEIKEGPSSLMVSRGTLYVGNKMRIPKLRAHALIQHELGTHMVTYFNANTQPFQLLHAGLAGYDELQEGLAVLAEFLVGGLSRPRLRLLAARVLAVKMLVEGANFIEVFRELDRTHDFEQKTAFTITLRVFRGGGFTKDASYLRGLAKLLDYLKEGGSLDILFLGKFAIKHIPVIQDLLWRKVLHEPPVKPLFMKDPNVEILKDRLRKGLSLLELTSGRKK